MGKTIEIDFLPLGPWKVSWMINHDKLYVLKTTGVGEAGLPPEKMVPPLRSLHGIYCGEKGFNCWFMVGHNLVRITIPRTDLNMS